MDIKKFEKLIDLVINEDNEKANELFHEICVEKSREIFESILAEDDMDMADDTVEESDMGGQTGDLLDEINAEEADEGMYEDEEEDLDFGDEEVEFGSDDEEGDEGDEEIEDAVVRIEDKLDQLMAEFEEIMGGGADDMGGDEEMEFDAEESEEDMMEADDEEMDEDDSVMEAVQLQKVSVTHGDNGAQTKSPVAANSGKAGMDSHPVDFADGDEKGRSAPGTKDLPGAGKFKNAPGYKGQDLSAAPKPKHGDDGANNKSPVAESRRSARRPIR